MTLFAPRQLYFVVAICLAVCAVISVFISAVALMPLQAFWLMTIAFAILGVACLVPAGKDVDVAH